MIPTAPLVIGPGCGRRCDAPDNDTQRSRGWGCGPEGKPGRTPDSPSEDHRTESERNMDFEYSVKIAVAHEGGFRRASRETIGEHLAELLNDTDFDCSGLDDDGVEECSVEVEVGELTPCGARKTITVSPELKRTVYCVLDPQHVGEHVSVDGLYRWKPIVRRPAKRREAAA